MRDLSGGSSCGDKARGSFRGDISVQILGGKYALWAENKKSLSEAENFVIFRFCGFLWGKMDKTAEKYYMTVFSEGDMEPGKIAELVERGDEHLFYVSGAWQRKRLEVLEADRWECQVHKARGRYRRAELVHHVLHLRDRPELGLEDLYVDEDGVEHRQLLSVCRECHETVCHPERMRKCGEGEGFVSEERWD